MEEEWFVTAMLQRWSVSWRENGHVKEVVTLMEGEWLLQRTHV